MREFDSLNEADWAQIQQGANGNISGTLSEWPRLKAALDKCGIFLPLPTTAEALKWACEAAYWQARSDEFSAKAGEAYQKAHDQEAYTQELFSERERLKTELQHLRAAFVLEASYAAQGDYLHLPQILGGHEDKME